MKKALIVIVIVIVIVFAWFMWSKTPSVTAPSGTVTAPSGVEIGENDTTPVITEELDSLEIPELDAELGEFNEDLNSL